MAGKGHLPPGVGHVTPAEPEVGTGQLTSAETEVWAVHVIPSEPEVLLGHVTPAEPEVARPAPSWIPAGAILARGLMSLMGTTCVGLGGSPVWRGRVTFPLGESRDTRRTGSGAGTRDSHWTGSGGGSLDSR